MSFPALRPTLRFEVNFEDDALSPHPAYLESLSPIAFWRFNEKTGTTAFDSAGSFDATYTGAYDRGNDPGAFAAYGDRDTCFESDGSSGYAFTAASSTWQNLYTTYTLGAWIYPLAGRTSANTVAGIISCPWPDSSTRIPFMLNYGNSQGTIAAANANNLWAGHYTGLGTNVYSSIVGPALGLNTWYFCVVTYAGANTWVLYINGADVSGTVTNGGTANGAAAATRELWIGRGASRVATVSPYFPGYIDEAFVFDRALSAIEVANLYRYYTISTPDEGNYVDLSDRLRPMSIRRGRSDPVSRVEAGNLTVTLDNQDGLLNPAPIVNLLANPSMEATEEPYLPFTVEGGTQTQTGGDRTGDPTKRSRVATSTGASGSTMYATTQRNGLVGMRPGKEYTFSAYVYLSSTGAPSLTDVWLEIVDEVAGDIDITAGSATIGATNAFYRLQVTATIRDAADAAYCRIVLNDADTGKFIAYDDVQLEEGDTMTTYCDGDQVDCDWAGAQHTSMSRRRASAEAPVKVIPMRRCRLTATWDSVDYGLFHGYIDRFAYTYPGMGTDAVVTLNVTDGTRILSNTSMRGFSRSSETTGDRVRAILAWAGIPPDQIDIEDGYISALALDSESVSSDVSALSLIREIEETERGVFFLSHDGLFTYQGSEFRNTEGVEQFLLDDQDEGVPYSDVAAIIDLATVVNNSTIENVAHASTTTTNEPESQQRYLLLSASEQSNWDTNTVSYVYRGEPYPLADSVEVRPLRDPATLWPIMLDLELGALGRIVRIRNDVDVFNGYMQYLEGVEHNIGVGNWTMNLRTSPTPVAPISASLWQTPVSKPLVKTSAASASGGGTTIPLPAVGYTAGKLYVIYADFWGSGGVMPSLPTITGTNTFVNIDNITSGTAIRAATWYVVATSTVTEALSFSFANAPGAAYDIVLIEIGEGFNATPIGDHPGTQSGSQTSGSVDVGTLTDARSVMLLGILKAASATPILGGAVSIYARPGTGSTSYHVCYGRVPNTDTITVDWSGIANGWIGTAIEIEAT